MFLATRTSEQDTVQDEISGKRFVGDLHPRIIVSLEAELLKHCVFYVIASPLHFLNVFLLSILGKFCEAAP